MLTRRDLLKTSLLLAAWRRQRSRSHFGTGSVHFGKQTLTGLLEIGPEEVLVFDGRKKRKRKLGKVRELALPLRDESNEELAELDEELHELAARLLADPTATADLDDWIACVGHGHVALAALGPPLAGPFWIVPDTTRHHAAHAASALAVDLAALDADGAVYAADGRSNADYASWECELLAVADGRVRRARDHMPDSEAYAGVADPDRANDLVLDFTGGVAFYQHLQQGSLEVAAGASVRRGDVLARIGNSGNASWPHLHFAVYEHFESGSGSGVLSVPVALDAFRVRGLRRNVSGKPADLDVKCTNVPLQEGWIVGAVDS